MKINASTRRQFFTRVSAATAAASVLRFASAAPAPGEPLAPGGWLAGGPWPVLAEYDRDHLLRIALPLGGIGTGTVSLGGRGDLRDWEIQNRPAKGYIPGRHFFAVYAKPEGGAPVARALEGALDDAEFSGASGSTAPNHGLPRFRDCAFRAAYPFGQVLLGDPGMPIDARIEAFNPLIPADADRSGIPVAVLRFVLKNKTDRPVAAAVAGTLTNFVADRAPGAEKVRRINAVREEPGIRGLLMSAEDADPCHEYTGTIALAALTDAPATYWPWWTPQAWNTDILAFWNDFAADGALTPSPLYAGDPPRGALVHGSMAVPLDLAPNAEASVTYLIAWHFPNRYSWTQNEKEGDCRGDDCGCAKTANWIGNYYNVQYPGAWEAVTQTAPNLAGLERDTLSFVNAFASSDLPAVVKEAALFNLSTLRTQTCFRTPDGFFFGFEGCNPGEGCCFGSCTHVWNYEQSTAFLFGDLARRMREVEFQHATNDEGLMAFRVNLPIKRAQNFAKAAADGQMGCLLKLYRDWQLCGDRAFLERHWPRAKKTIEFCWLPGGWDADQDGVMEGCQHNTMDVEYYGPNPQMGIWYLGALRAGEEMARAAGDAAFAAKCRDLFDRGSAWIDANLFNGEYYEHHIKPLPAEAIHPALRVGMGGASLEQPDFQLGNGCLVDQLVGQFLAHVCGLGHLTRPGHVRTTLESILKHNDRANFYGHFNNMRSYVLNDESALLMASYPRGNTLERPFPYHNEVMTGFEYAAAIGMLYEGMIDEGLECIRDIRARYNGRRRSPFDEAECGHHYARAMAAWAAVIALTGFRYSGVEQRIAFDAAPGKFFWAAGDAWGVIEKKPEDAGIEVQLAVLGGALNLERIEIAGLAPHTLPAPARLGPGNPYACRIAPA